MGTVLACYAVLFPRRIRDARFRPAPFPAIQDQSKPVGARSRDHGLTLWVEERGTADVAGNVRGALDTISKNEEFFNMTLAVLMTPE